LTKWVVRDERDLDVGVVEGSNFPGSEIVVIGMGMLAKHLNKMRTIKWDLVAIDEAHELRNPKTIKCQAVFGYRPKKDEKEELRVAPLTAPHRIAATGTPIWNKPIDMWPLIEWLDPIYWNSWWKFTQEFCGANDNGFARVVSGASNLEQLQVKLRESVMIRRLKRDVLTDLPLKTRQIVALETDGSEAAAERKALSAAGIDIEAKVADLKAKVELAKVGDSSEAYQAAVDALTKGFTASFDQIAKIRHETALAKVDRVVEYVANDLEAVDKLVVFAHHIDVIQKIAQGLTKFGVVAGWGEHAAQIRQQIVNRFQNESRIRVAVLGLIPFGVGFTLTSANLVVFAELDWVPARILQCEDRLHRIGQQSNVLAKHLILEGTIDGHMAKTQVRKLDIMDKALDRQKAEKAGPTETDPWKVAEASEMEVPGRAVSVVRQEIADEAAKLTPAQIKAVSVGLKLLASYCDGARTLDGAGFSKVDVAIGKDLANRLFLSPKQAALGLRIISKYRRQLPDGLLK
jgi:SWI/SNF-related matrix-associated actin-dependent regulator 1 of chromatin subfamily A